MFIIKSPKEKGKIQWRENNKDKIDRDFKMWWNKLNNATLTAKLWQDVKKSLDRKYKKKWNLNYKNLESEYSRER